MENKRVIAMSISYAHEAPLGELLKVYTAESDGVYYFRTVRSSDGLTNAEANIIVE